MLTDRDRMPWGKHKGTQMINVPANYLLWLYENNKCSGEVKEYIENMMEVLKIEKKQKQ